MPTEATLLRQILHRLDRIDNKLEMQSNPAKFLAIAEKGAIMRKALATGNKKKILAAEKFINGG